MNTTWNDVEKAVAEDVMGSSTGAVRMSSIARGIRTPAISCSASISSKSVFD